MLKNLKIDITSQRTAYYVGVFHTITLVLLISLLTGFGIFIGQGCSVFHIGISRILYVEVLLHVLFFPFASTLLIGIKYEKLHLIRLWIRSTITQILYLFLLNVVVQVYITVHINADYGLIVLAYFFVFGGLSIGTLIYFDNYYNFKLTQKKDEGDIIVPTIEILKCDELEFNDYNKNVIEMT